MRNLAIKAKFIFSFHTDPPAIFEDGIILIDDEKIVDIGKNLKIIDREVFDFPNHVIIPGLINSHTHAAMTLFRGYADDLPLHTWLNDYIWPLEAKLTKEQVYIGAKVAAYEMISGGTTLANSMYWFPNEEARAFSELGVRFIANLPIISDMTNLSSNKNLVPKWHDKDNLTRIAIALHTPFTATKDDFIEAYEYKTEYNLKNEVPIILHTHLEEARDEMEQIRKFSISHGFEIGEGINTSTEYLNSIGVLDDCFLAAHCVELKDSDMRTLSTKKVGISANTVSNMKLGNNLPRINDALQQSEKIGLGTDGASSNNSLDMFDTMKSTALTQKFKYADPAVFPSSTVLKLATIGGASALNWTSTGSLEKGKLADFIVIDLNKPQFYPSLNSKQVMSHLVYSASSRDVTDVMIHGKWKMRNRKVLDVDEEELKEEFLTQTHILINS